MNATLEDRLRQHYAERARDVSDQGPGLASTATMTWFVKPTRSRGSRVVFGLSFAAAAALIGFVKLNRAEPSGVAADRPPGITGRVLPPYVDPDIAQLTSSDGRPLRYWRWFPDLEFAERSLGDAGTEFCWRTPTGSDCVDDTFNSPDVGIIPTDQAVIFLARPAILPITPPPTDPMKPKLKMGPPAKVVTVTLSDGTVVQARVFYRRDYGVGYARLPLPAGVTVVKAVSS
jgi:hypothetical protein